MNGQTENALPPSVTFGYPEEWRAFTTRHPEFLRRFPNLEKALDTAFIRTWQSSTLLDRTIYFLGRLVLEEFMEILLLCANGYGIGAQKLVRGMYERAVTARYLRDQPEEVENFLAFHKVADHKLMTAVRSSIGPDVFSQEQAEQIERDFQNVRERFIVTDCAKCGTTRLNYTWSKRDFVSMARMSGDIGKLIVPAYYKPTREAHSTMGAIFSRLDPVALSRDDRLIFHSAAQPDSADDALISAHNILLNVLDLQKEHFRIKELEPQLQTCFEDFMVIWRKRQPPQAASDLGESSE